MTTQELYDAVKAAIAGGDADTIREAVHRLNNRVNQYRDGKPNPPPDLSGLTP